MRKIQSKIINEVEIQFISASIVGDSVYYILFDVNNIEVEKGFIECSEVNEELISSILANHFDVTIL
jgi:hypothetical protein